MATQIQKQPKKFNATVVVVGIIVIVLLLALPLLLAHGSEFGGTDDLASNTITTLAPDYNSGWITNWWEPAGETESALFALQAAAGGILIGYFFGYLHGKKKSGA
jgi:cobalt/nickel transport protein